MATVDHLITAWEAAVRYRQELAAHGGIPAIRPHLEDMDTYGVIVEMAEDGLLIGEPRAVMSRIIEENLRLPLSLPMYDPAPEIYDAAVDLLTSMGVLKHVEEDD